MTSAYRFLVEQSAPSLFFQLEVSYPTSVTDVALPPATYIFGSGVGGTAALDLATMVVAVCASRSPIVACIHCRNNATLRKACINITSQKDTTIMSRKARQVMSKELVTQGILNLSDSGTIVNQGLHPSFLMDI